MVEMVEMVWKGGYKRKPGTRQGLEMRVCRSFTRLGWDWLFGLCGIGSGCVSGFVETGGRDVDD